MNEETHLLVLEVIDLVEVEEEGLTKEDLAVISAEDVNLTCLECIDCSLLHIRLRWDPKNRGVVELNSEIREVWVVLRARTHEVAIASYGLIEASHIAILILEVCLEVIEFISWYQNGWVEGV